MKRFLGALAGIALAYTGSAQAADLSRPPPPMAYAPAPNWTGFYIGANGGWGWSNVDTTVDPFGHFLFPFNSFTVSSKRDGAVFGGQIGYNWQLGPAWVLGVETDFDGAGISGVGTGPFGLTTVTTRTNWLASVRGRLGYVWGPGLLYFTGGGAWQDVTASAFGNSFSTTNSGFVIGGGYEWMIASNWTVRGEYLFYDFGNSDSNSVAFGSLCAVGSPACSVALSRGTNETSVFRLGVNYKW